MRHLLYSALVVLAALAWAAPAHAAVTLYAEGPASVSVGTEVPIYLKARVTESINAIALTVLLAPESVQVVRFDDSMSAVRLWLERGTPVTGGVRLQGVIPGGIGPAFTDVIELGTIWVRPVMQDTIRLSFADADVFLNQPTPTRDVVKTVPLAITTGPADGGGYRRTVQPVLLDAEVIIVREPELNEGKRSIIFDIKTDQGTADAVRIRERWLGIAGTWRTVTNSSTLSDGWGFSILDVALPESMGGSYVDTIVPSSLIILWVLAGFTVCGWIYRRRMRHS